MLKIQAKKGLLNDVKEGKYRVHHMVQRNAALARVRVGDRVQLFSSPQRTCDVYVSAVRRHYSLNALLGMEQWKQLTPEIDTQARSHRLLRRQLARYADHTFLVLEYELAAIPPQTTTI
jgi:ASC-1-like (ASCH) protein